MSGMSNRDAESLGGLVQLSRWRKSLPLVILMSWLLFTVTAYLFGPFEYAVSNTFVVYIVAVHLALVAGYLRGMRSLGRDYRGVWRGKRIVQFSLAVILLFTLVNLASTGGADLARLGMALENPAEAYKASVLRQGGTVFSYIGIITAPLTVISLTLGTFYWSSLGALWRVVLAFIFVVIILGNIGGSIRAGIVSSAFLAVCGFGAAYYAGAIRMPRITKAVIVVVAVVSVVGFFQYTVHLTERRHIGRDVLFNPLTFERANEEHLMYKILPARWHAGATSVVFYVSHGYYKLGQALELPFNGFSFGAGNSMFLVRNVVRLSGWEGFEDLSYGIRLARATAHGILGNYWSTFYTWIASDVTFPGTVIVIFFIGYFLALAWIDATRIRNPLAIPAFACIAYLVFSFPMNNPMQDGGGITAFAGLPIAWLLMRRRYPRPIDVPSGRSRPIGA